MARVIIIMEDRGVQPVHCVHKTRWSRLIVVRNPRGEDQLSRIGAGG